MIQNRQQKNGFTIIELLVVISIMAILVVLIVPRIRTVNKDRNIREAARKVGALFANASQQAVVDGSAGVLFERNLNFIFRLPPGETRGFTGDPIEVPFAVTTMYMLRAVPSFSGDDDGDVASFSGSTVTIARPYDHDEGNGEYFIVPRDTIFLNNQSFGYEITSVTEDPTSVAGFPNGTLDLFIDLGSFPTPAFTSSVPYRIQRQPRKVASSRVDLPDGYMVNLRFSGAISEVGSFPETTLSSFTTTDDTEARFFLNGQGGIDRIQTGAGFDTCTDVTTSQTSEDFKTFNSLFLMVCEDDLELPIGEDQLMVPSNLWVTVNRTGNVNVASMAPQGPAVIGIGQEEDPASFASRLITSRQISRTRQTATQ